MRKIIPVFLLFVFLLSACGGLPLPSGSTAPTSPSDSEMATRVAGILTAMPTVTGDAMTQPTQAQALPTIAPSATQAPATEAPTVAPTATATQAPPQATPTENLTPVATFTPQGGATQAPTALPSGDDPRVKLGSPTWTDTMDGSNNWPTGDNEYTKIDFSGGSLLFTPLKPWHSWF